MSGSGRPPISRKKKLITVLISVSAALLFLELTLRILDRFTQVDFFHVMRDAKSTAATTKLRLVDLLRLSETNGLIYELTPGVAGEFKGAAVTINAQGRRGPVIPQQRADPDALRLVLLGDSHSFGWGVTYEETFAVRIAERFKEDHPQGPALEIINLAVPGYNTYQEVESLQAKGLAYDPDVLLMLSCRNDAGLASFIRSRESFFTLRRSFLYDVLVVRLKALARGKDFRNRHFRKGLGRTEDQIGDGLLDEVIAQEMSRVPPEYREMVGKESLWQSLDRLAALGKERSLPVVFCFYDEYESSPLKDYMAGHARDLGFSVVDLQPGIDAHLMTNKERIESLLLSLADPHPKPAYHRIIGDAIYDSALRDAFENQLAQRKSK